MSAYKIILKRSSVLGKRPNSQLLEPGELGLNTNSVEPGIYFEVSDGSVIKAGPTSYLPAAPTTSPAQGELWVDSDTNTLSIGSNTNTWESIAAPFLGGTNGVTIFVAPDYFQATDSLKNDGQTLPFRSLNRAIIEVGKTIVQNAVTGVPSNARYTIMVAPSSVTVFNGPGQRADAFTVNFAPGPNQSNPNIDNLETFNHPDGGLIVPRGVSIVGMDLKKSVLRPSYVPTYNYPGFPANYSLDPKGPQYTKKPLANVFRWSGNSYLTNFSVTDKLEQRFITSINPGNIKENGLNPEVAVFSCETTHGLDINDYVYIRAEANTPNSPNFPNGAYYVKAITPYEFVISRQTFVGINKESTPQLIKVYDLDPKLISGSNFNIFNVQNIYPYFRPDLNEPFEVGLYSAHRLSVVGNASKEDFNEFYTKIQKAFPNIFGETVSDRITLSPEYTIIGNTEAPYPKNTAANTTENTEPYIHNVMVRSSYGMAGCDINGNLVSGFKVASAKNFSIINLQRDPGCYEIYTTKDNISDWDTLTKIVADSLNREITSVPLDAQLEFLNRTSIEDIRYLYSTKIATDASGKPLGDSGVADVDNDYRHYGVRVRGANTLFEGDSIQTLGSAVGVWALDGAQVSLSNSKSTFGSVGLLSEGFAGIGTLGGAELPNQGFLQAGVVRPLLLTQEDVSNVRNQVRLPLGPKVIKTAPDPTDPDTQLIYLSSAFSPANILPYSLTPGSAIYIEFRTTEENLLGLAGSDTGNIIIDDIASKFNGTQTKFTLTSEGENLPKGTLTGDLLISLGGVIQSPEVSYTFDESTITFAEPPRSNFKFSGRVLRGSYQAPVGVTYRGFLATDGKATIKLLEPNTKGAVIRVRASDSNIPNKADFSTGTCIPYISRFKDPRTETDRSYGLYIQSTNPSSKAPKPGDLLRLNQTGQKLSNTINRNFQFDPGSYGGVSHVFKTDLVKTSPFIDSPTFNNKLNDTTQTTTYALYMSLVDQGLPWMQLGDIALREVFNSSAGTFTTFGGKNFYAAENNDWETLYYETVYNPTNGPYKLSPDEASSPYVLTSTLIRQSETSAAYQGYVPDGFLPAYISGEESPRYMRGATIPFSAIYNEFLYDKDDASGSFGFVYKTRAITSDRTTTKDSIIIQPYVEPSKPPFRDISTFGCPQLIELELSSVEDVIDPTQGISVLLLQDTEGKRKEYIRVIKIVDKTVTAISNYYPKYSVELDYSTPWKSGTKVSLCSYSDFPEISEYDLNWAISKRTVLRYYRLMGYSFNDINPYLRPQYYGDRVLLNEDLPFSPSQGYARLTAAWPVEFNQPSVIQSTAHTWQSCGYIDYSRGLPKYQVNQFSRKLGYDFLATSLWGGVLNVNGITETREAIISAPFTQVETGKPFA